jgi:hypothetical protein
MLPTHIIRVQDHTESAHQGGDDSMAYPPPRQSAHNGFSNRGKSKSSLQSIIFGERGVTSFTVPAQTPLEKQAEPVSQSDGDRSRISAGSTTQRRASPSRWNTLEFYLYALVFAVAVPWMCWVPISLSLGKTVMQVSSLRFCLNADKTDTSI